MGREGLWAATVEIYAGNVLHDSLGGLNGVFWVGGANLVDEVGLFDGVGGEDGAGFAVVGDYTGDGCVEGKMELGKE